MVHGEILSKRVGGGRGEERERRGGEGRAEEGRGERERAGRERGEGEMGSKEGRKVECSKMGGEKMYVYGLQYLLDMSSTSILQAHWVSRS